MLNFKKIVLLCIGIACVTDSFAGQDSKIDFVLTRAKIALKNAGVSLVDGFFTAVIVDELLHFCDLSLLDGSSSSNQSPYMLPYIEYSILAAIAGFLDGAITGCSPDCTTKRSVYRVILGSLPILAKLQPDSKFKLFVVSILSAIPATDLRRLFWELYKKVKS